MPNLVMDEEKELFGLEGVEVTAGVKMHPRSAKIAKWRALGPYRGARDGEKSRSMKLMAPIEAETGERLRQFEAQSLKEVRK